MNAVCDDILLLLAQALDIDTFFNFRMVCRKYYDLTNSHMRGLAPEIARSTLPRLSKILDDEGFRRSPTPLESMRWLKRLRYEYLAAVMFEHVAPHRMVQINEDLIPQGFDPLIVVASGWHVLARLSKLTREADLRFRSRYNDPARMVNLKCEERTWNLNLCRQWLDLVVNLKISEIYGFKWLCRCLIQEVFGFNGTSIRYSDRHLSDLKCVAWLTTWIFRVGPEPFWIQWIGQNAKSPQRLLETSIEAAWQKQRKPLHKWELDNVRNIERQIWVLLYFASQSFDSYDFDDPSHLHRIKAERMRCLTGPNGADHFTSWAKVLQVEPIAPPERWFRSVTFNASVDWLRLGYEPPPPPEVEPSYGDGRRRRRQPDRSWARIPKKLGVRHRRIYHQWRRAWQPEMWNFDREHLQRRLAVLYYR